MASAAVRSKAVVLLLLIHCLLFAHIAGGDFVLDAVFCVFSSFAVISLRKRELVALLLLSS